MVVEELIEYTTSSPLSLDDMQGNKTDNNGDDNTFISMEQLYPALIRCFGIILCGYLAGRLKIISNSETKGLNTFVGTFALPCLIFSSLVELNWNTVNWNFLLAVLIAKAVIFLSVLIISLLISRPINYGRAGMLAIFCTQSNDFAIGYPILVALYQKIHPEYASYLYLMAPISLAILNPIGYILMEIDKNIKRRNEVTNQTNNIPVCPEAQATQNNFNGKFIVILKTIKSIFLNPILLMTILGIIGGIIFQNGLPEVVSGIVKSFGNSFPATALFLLGIRMVGKGGQLRGPKFLLPGILILVKLLALPLVIRQTVNIMQAGSNFTETTELSTFGFLYGTFPAAPGAFVVATRYGIDVDLIASSMVACTFISAPLMYISAKMISLSNLKPEDYVQELNQFSFDISVTGAFACIWVLVIFTLTKRCQRMPQRVTTCLVLSQFLCCVGVFLWSKVDDPQKWVSYVQFFIFNIGAYSSRLWTAILAITILFLQCRSLCFTLKMWPYMILCAWGIPVLISASLLLINGSPVPNDKKNPSFAYGHTQVAIVVFLLVMCFIVTAGCLILHQRYKRRFERYLTLSRELSNPESVSSDLISNATSTTNLLHNDVTISNMSDGIETPIPISDDATNNQKIGVCDGNTVSSCCKQTSPPVVDIEDLLTKTNTNGASGVNAVSDHRNSMCGTSFNCASTSRQNCQNLLQQYEEHTSRGLEPIECPDDVDEYQTLKHIVLLILLLCSMFVSLALSIWTLVMEGMSGIYLELSFLDVFLNYGQSIIVFAVFITDSGQILLPLIKYWRKIWYGANVLILPSWDSLSSETKYICEQFRHHHLETCKKEIAKDRRWRIKVYKKTFFGTDFVNWLIEVGLARDRMEATHYAKHLVEGRVLRHINNVYHFYDKQLLYTFCCRI